ncbi:hypothetical protein BDV96DRAFT_10919 [Lophiotrema nucula]|uniref:Uncharacterized protein n=1 Tax=Lophiotrema nucula TaxID=690887 RepID=A0A6A5ZVY3_9PLEO|nr:hypothetical protein BDV96DRAFT_10919 [Lophiotrema nucula]
MRSLCAVFVTAAALVWRVRGNAAPEITTLAEGYNYIARLPCTGCPFLYQDTSDGKEGPWVSREDDNVLLFNISLSYSTPILQINSQQVYPKPPSTPRIHANQVLNDISVDRLSSMVDSGQLETPHGGFFGISYHSSQHSVKDSPNSLMFQFHVFEAWSGFTSPATSVEMDDLEDPALSQEQEMLELVLIQKPLLSPLEKGSSYEIARIGLVEKPELGGWQTSVKYIPSSDFGKPSAPSSSTAHAASASMGEGFIDWISSGVFALFIFILAIIAVFVIVCLFCIFGMDFFKKDEYGAAQTKKHGRNKRLWGWGRAIEKRRGDGYMRTEKEEVLLFRYCCLCL